MPTGALFVAKPGCWFQPTGCGAVPANPCAEGGDPYPTSLRPQHEPHDSHPDSATPTQNRPVIAITGFRIIDHPFPRIDALRRQPACSFAPPAVPPWTTRGSPAFPPRDDSHAAGTGQDEPFGISLSFIGNRVICLGRLFHCCDAGLPDDDGRGRRAATGRAFLAATAVEIQAPREHEAPQQQCGYTDP
jgi:hypothetical protein